MRGNAIAADRPVVWSRPGDAEHAGNGVAASERVEDVVSRHGPGDYDDCSIGARKTNNPEPPPTDRERVLREFAKDVGRRLKLLREELGLNQPQMAARIGVSRARYSHWENGRHLPNDELAVIRFCNETEATLDYIYRGQIETLPDWLAIRLRGRAQGLIPPP